MWWNMPGFSGKDTEFSQINETSIPSPDEPLASD